MQDRRRLLTFRGVAAWSTPYEMGYYTETIKRGAFDKTLASGPDVQLLVNHEGLPIARTTNGSLRLSDVGNGLEFTATASASDPDAAAVATKVKSGLMDQCSFAFRVVQQTWDEDYTQRDITEVSMDRGDVSIVNYGANPNTSAHRTCTPQRTPPPAQSLRGVGQSIGDWSRPTVAAAQGNQGLDAVGQKRSGPAMNRHTDRDQGRTLHSRSGPRAPLVTFARRLGRRR